MPQENVEVMEAVYAAITRRDLEGFLAVAHPDIEFHSLIAEADGRVYRGHDGVREWWQAVIEPLGIRPGTEKIESFRDRGITRMRLTGTIEGVEVPQDMWHAWRLCDGLLVWWQTFRTKVQALEAAGLRE
jgi:ketosteroid isomerase-like protein